jgi:hypothetical protein
MDERKLTVRHLRELARKHLGRGHSKLKTKAELIAALRAWLPRSPQQKPARAKAAKTPAKPKVPAKVTTFFREQSGTGAAAADGLARQQRIEPSSTHLPQHRAEPLVEGFFIARVAGEQEARRHHLTEASARLAALKRDGERAADLPNPEGDDRIHALPRDPETLFIFWDLAKRTREEAARGLKFPRPVLRVFEQDRLMGEMEFAPESRSFYVHHLRPAHRYRVEAHFVGLDGRSKQIGHASNTVELPASGHSPGEARFMQLPWGLDLRRLKSEVASNGVRFRTLDRDRARLLATRLRPELARPRDASSDRRGWQFSPSGRP